MLIENIGILKRGENCYAVSNAEELKELLDDVKRILTHPRLFKMQGNY